MQAKCKIDLFHEKFFRSPAPGGQLSSLRSSIKPSPRKGLFGKQNPSVCLWNDHVLNDQETLTLNDPEGPQV